MDNFSGFPSLNFLLTFESVARHLSFTNAAKELCVTQAAVSHQIKALEDYLGSKLFLREKHRIFLSEEGQQLLPSVVSGLQGIADSIDSLRTDEFEDTLVVGVGSSFSANCVNDTASSVEFDPVPALTGIFPLDSLTHNSITLLCSS